MKKIKNRWNLITYFILLFIITTFIMAGCTSMNKELLEDESMYTELEPLNLEIGYEPFDLRVNLRRQSRDEDVVFRTDSKYMTVELAYTPTGFYIGNGVFVDTNFNLCLDVLQLYKIDKDADFSIKRSFSKSVLKDQLFLKEGDHFELKAENSKKSRIVVDFDPDVVEIKRKPGTNMTIQWDEGDFVAAPTGVIKAIETHTISGEDKEFFVKKPLKKIYVIQDKNGISFGNFFNVTMEGNRMVFTFENGKKYFLVKIHDDVYFFDNMYIGSHISREGNTMTVYEKSRPTMEFILEEN